MDGNELLCYKNQKREIRNYVLINKTTHTKMELDLGMTSKTESTAYDNSKWEAYI